MMFFKTLVCEYNSFMAMLRKRVRLYIFFFLKWRENIRFQAQTDTGVNGNFTLKFYICFQASCFVSKIFQTVREMEH